MSEEPGRVARLWNGFFFTGASAERLGVLRIALGLGLLAYHALQFNFLVELDRNGARWHYLDPIWYFRLLGVQDLDPIAAQFAFVVLMLATLAFAAGFFTRSSIVVMLLGILYLKGVRDSVAADVHHRYLIPFAVLIYFAFSRCGDVLSLDARRRRRRGDAPAALEQWEASWPIKASQLYIACFYLWGAIAKARMTGLVWAEPARIQGLLLARAVRFGFEDGVPAGSTWAYTLAQNELVCAMLAGSTYGFGFGFPLILWVRRPLWRWLFFAGVTFFHVANFVLIQVKFLFLPFFFLVFFDVSAPLRWWRQRRGGTPSRVREGSDPAPRT